MSPRATWPVCLLLGLLAPPPAPAEPAHRELTVTGRYLNLPVKTGAPRQRMRYVLDGRTVREFEIELPDGEPGFWVFDDVADFKGQRLRLEVDALPAGSRALDLVTQGDEIAGAGGLYREKRRPQFHFTSRRGWLNDPNGLVYDNDTYHLFYQHNPYGWDWGNMHWGHAVSKDLVHWHELPIALYPRKFGDWCFSGSAVVDHDNTSGLKAGAGDLLVAAYTSTGRGECPRLQQRPRPDLGRVRRQPRGQAPRPGPAPALACAHEAVGHGRLRRDRRQARHRLLHRAGPQDVAIPEPH